MPDFEGWTGLDWLTCAGGQRSGRPTRLDLQAWEGGLTMDPACGTAHTRISQRLGAHGPDSALPPAPGYGEASRNPHLDGRAPRATRLVAVRKDIRFKCQ